MKNVYTVTYRGETVRVRGMSNAVRIATDKWRNSKPWRDKTGNHKFPIIKPE